MVGAGTCLGCVLVAVLTPRFHWDVNTVILLSFLAEVPGGVAAALGVRGLADRHENKLIAGLAIAFSVLAVGAPGFFMGVLLL